MECVVCGNRYAQSFSIEVGGESFAFDCFECAIHKLAPECAHCGCRVIGHGEEAGGDTYCCHHCARAAGAVASGGRPAPSGEAGEDDELEQDEELDDAAADDAADEDDVDELSSRSRGGRRATAARRA